MAFAGPTDVTNAMEGLSPPLPSQDRIQSAIDAVEARLRLMIPDLEVRIALIDAYPEQPTNDLALMAKDVVVQAALRRVTSTGPQAQSTTQQAGPFSTTVRYSQDKSGTFSDEDLDLLRGSTDILASVGTIRLGPVDWSRQ